MRIGRTVMLLLLALALLCGAAHAEDTVELIIASRTAQSFTDEPVAEEDLLRILEAGLAATSAINQQPWFFVAVTNRDVMNEIGGSGAAAPAGGWQPADGFGAFDGLSDGARPSGGAPAGGAPVGGSAKAGLGDSPAAIIIYMNKNTASPDASFDCGLACENMFIAARALGYGAKIVSSPTMQLNGANHDALCEKLGVDKACTAVAVLLIGREADAADAATGASVRSDMAGKVSIVE